MWKYFSTRFGDNPESKIKELRKEFPNMIFKAGMHKDKRGIFILKDTEKREYAEMWETTRGDIFFSPNENDKKFILEHLKDFKSDYEDRIEVKLSTVKISLEIFPASAIPSKVLFTRRMPKAENEDSPFNTTDEYGKMAYELYQASQKGEELRFDDEKFLKFIELILTRSYKLPMEMWDALGIVTFRDFDPIFASGCGISWEHLKKTLEESNGQP